MSDISYDRKIPAMATPQLEDAARRTGQAIVSITCLDHAGLHMQFVSLMAFLPRAGDVIRLMDDKMAMVVQVGYTTIRKTDGQNRPYFKTVPHVIAEFREPSEAAKVPVDFYRD